MAEKYKSGEAKSKEHGTRTRSGSAVVREYWGERRKKESLRMRNFAKVRNERNEREKRTCLLVCVYTVWDRNKWTDTANRYQ